MNNKGFTLVELIGSLVILAIIAAIAIPGINSIARGVKEKQRKNIINRIEIEASNYAFKTKKLKIFVDELIKEGYIEANEQGKLLNPVDNTSLNCYIVEIKKVKNYYKATFIDGNSYEANGECNESVINN